MKEDKNEKKGTTELKKEEVVKKKRINTIEKKKNAKEIKPEVKEDKKAETKIKKNSPKKSNKESETTVSFNIVEVIVIIVITGLIVSVCSGLIVYNNYDKFISNGSSTKMDTDLNEFINSYNHILNSYVNEVDASELLDAAIEGMYTYLNDEYSSYIDEETTETLTERLEGTYEGVGIEITQNAEGQIYITRIFSNTPAEKAGLQVNDIIVTLNGESYLGKTVSEFSNKIKESKEKEFKIGFIRDGEVKDVTVKRDVVYIDSVNSKEYDNVGYLQIETFSAVTGKQMEEKLKEFGNNINSLIIDVRDNTGGFLSAAYDTAELLVEKGSVVYQLKNKDGKIDKKISKNEPIRKFDKIIILTNSTSASASEILACSLKENLDAITVGKRTYGKGTVQETSKLSSGAMVKYTTAYWLTPKGNSINEIGLEADYIVEQNAETNIDEQLEKALELAK